MTEDIRPIFHVSGNEGGDIVRLHEKWMDTMDRRVEKVETSINKIPWILLIAVINLAVSLIIIIVRK